MLNQARTTMPPAAILRKTFCCLIAIICIHLFSIQTFAQDFGGFKPGIKWQQFNTPAVRVIFPQGLELQASRVAGNIQYLNDKNRSSIGPLSKKIDLILNNQGVLSNGYVTLMPYRSEFYTTPPQDGFSLGTLSWLDMLSVHEYRHALQYMNLRQGYTKYAWWLFGDAGWGTMINLTTPTWFFEGDAVATETALSNQGRGRMPSFLQPYKSLLLTGRNYTYMKARNGSYRDMVPDAYELGYLLCSYGREKFGNDLWSKVITRTAWMNGIIYPFSDAVMVLTGLNTRQFYKKALADYTETWSNDLRNIETTPFTTVSEPSRTVTDYRFPVYQPNGNLLVYKKSYKETGAIYQIAGDGSERRICTTGISSDPYFTANGKQITWTEVTWDERYSAKNYSDVVIYQTDRSRKIYLTRKQRYFSPSFSPDGTRIAVVEIDSAGISRIKILDSQSGVVMHTLPNPAELIHTYPKWDIDGNSIICSARTPEANMLIISQSISTGKISGLTSGYNQVIGEVLVTPESILFTSGFSGINNIFSLSRADGSIRQLTGSTFGAYYPAISPDNKVLVYTDYHSRGYSLVSASVDSLLWKPVNPESQKSADKFNFSYFQTEGGNIFDKIPDLKPEAGPYRPLGHPASIHSWSLSPTVYSTGLNITSDNVLNNLHFEGGFRYYYIEEAPGYNASIKYGGFYPVLSAGISRYYRHAGILEVLTEGMSRVTQSVDNQISLNLEVPLNFTKGAFYRQANIGIGYNFISVKDLSEGFNTPGDPFIVSALEGNASVTIKKKRAYQNITTPLGLGLELTANHSIAFTRGMQYQAIADFAIRGLAPNHNLVLSAGWKYEPDHNEYRFMDLFLYPRGYQTPAYDWMFTLQSSYHLPLAYPDFGFLGIFYCSRIRVSLYADFGYASAPGSLNLNSNGILGSAGAELIFDTRWLNLVDIPMGVRFSLLLTPEANDPPVKMNWEFVVPIIRL